MHTLPLLLQMTPYILTNDRCVDKDRGGAQEVFKDMRAGGQTRSHTSPRVIGLSECKWWLLMTHNGHAYQEADPVHQE